MKLLKSLLKISIVVIIIIGLIAARPTKAQFAEYYVSQHATGFGKLFDGAFETIIKQRTEVKNYLVFSLFEVDGEDRYIGILGTFFGRSTTEQVTDTFEKLIEQAKDAIGSLNEN